MSLGGDRPFRVLGLSVDAETVWRLLLRRPDLDPDGLLIVAGMGRNRAEAAVEELRAHGLVESTDTGPLPTPVDPRVAVEHAITVEQRELTDRLSQLADLRAHLPTLAAEYAQGRQRVDAELPIEVVDGLDATRTRLRQLARTARSEVLSIQHGLIPSAAMASALDTDLTTLRRGVTERTLVERNSLVDDESFQYFGTLAAAGEAIRLVDRSPARVLLVDAEVAVIPLDATDHERGAMFVRVRTMVDMCVFLFEQMWGSATPLFVVGATDAPTGRSARVLELMAAGSKDERIARALGVGVRTVRRDIATLMANLGENTRASTVAAAIRRGWLSA